MYLFEEVILPPGEKIKRIRGYLGLKQYEITGGKFTRNLVSYIENGKTKLVKDTAEIIAKNINKIAIEKEIPLQIDANYLMKEEVDQANDILDKYIQLLCDYKENENIFEANLEKALNILKTWDIVDKKALIYEIAGDYYFDNKKFNKSYIKYFKSLENHVRIQDYFKTALLYYKLGRTSIWLNNYQESIDLSKYAILTLDKYNIDDRDLMGKLIFNIALVYKKLNRYDRCLDELLKLENLLGESIDKHQYIDISILKANSYFEQKKYSLAEEIYLDILNKSYDIESEGIINFNLGEIYQKYSKYNESIKYLEKSLNLRIKADSYYLLDSYIALGKSYSRIGEYELSQNVFQKALIKAREEEKYEHIIEIYKELLRQYIKLEHTKDIHNLINEVEIITKENITLEKKVIINEIKDIFIEGAHYFIERNPETSKEILSFGLKIIDQN